jgi:hypothetical protein
MDRGKVPRGEIEVKVVCVCSRHSSAKCTRAVGASGGAAKVLEFQRIFPNPKSQRGGEVGVC